MGEASSLLPVWVILGYMSEQSIISTSRTRHVANLLHSTVGKECPPSIVRAPIGSNSGHRPRRVKNPPLNKRGLTGIHKKDNGKKGNVRNNRQKNTHRRVKKPPKFDFRLAGIVFGCTLAVLALYHMAYGLTKQQASFFLGYGLVVFGAASKLPYIFNLEEAQTARGVSMGKAYMDVVALTFNVLFNVHRKNPFFTWGEKAFLLVQEWYIMSLLWKVRNLVYLQVNTKLTVPNSV